MNYDKYEIIRDTREKHGWDFESFDKCEGVIRQGLKTGDYTIKGLESAVCIERKASTREISMNLGRKKKPFQAEMERMKDFDHSFIVCEFSMDDLINFPKNSGIPSSKQKFVKITGKYMLKTLIEFQLWYDTKILFCDNKHNAFLVANSIFKRVNELTHNSNVE